jgi:hypothetical protein
MHIAYAFNCVRKILAVTIHYGNGKPENNPIHVDL